jgi:hypothetical protein
MAYTTIDNPELYFQVKLYTGTGTSTAFTLDGSEDMQPDLVWLKERGGANSHVLTDAVRGATKSLWSDVNNAESTQSTALTSFNSDGFTLGDATWINNSSDTFVAWCWKESATAGFDIVSYTGTGSANNVSHSLSAVPKWIIVKNRDTARNWNVYYGDETDYLQLNDTSATTDNVNKWNDTAPTSSVFTVNTSSDVNKSSDAMIAYLFAEKQGFSKFGSYTGNGSTDGTFIYLGFRPAFVIAKRTDSTANWYMMTAKISDSGGGNPLDRPLFANDTQAENDGDNNVDLLSNGFKIRGSGSAQNGSGATYIFMAFAEAPFVNSNGVPCNAR